MLADEPTGPTLDALPDELLRLVYAAYHARCRSLWDLMWFISVSRRFSELAANFVEVLALTGSSERGMLLVPFTRAGHRMSRRVGLLAPFAWAARFSSLRELEITHLSWSGAARLLTLLRAWPALEQLELRFEYDHRDANALRAVSTAGQELVDDLACVLRMGGLPRLRYLWLGNLDCHHCFGQRFDEGSLAQRGTLIIDDGELLETLQPTAAIWWMAERASHVRCSKLHQFTYELEHGADVAATVGAFGLLDWMSTRLAHQKSSSTGQRAVRALLLSHGAVDSAAEAAAAAATPDGLAVGEVAGGDGLGGGDDESLESSVGFSDDATSDGELFDDNEAAVLSAPSDEESGSVSQSADEMGYGMAELTL